MSILKWVGWFSHRRLFELISNTAPAEAENLYLVSQERLDLAA